MGGRLAAGVFTVTATVGGCALPGSGQSAPPDEAQTLWSARTEFVGDNSRVAALADGTGLRLAGVYTLSLQTEQAPYGMTVAFDSLDESYDEVDFTSDATLMLGLVANLDIVSLTSDHRSYSLTTSDASEMAGFDVKELGRDESKLAEYLGLATD